MRVSEQRIREAIQHPDARVREFALGYFVKAYRRDPWLMPEVIQAVETYGADEGQRLLIPARRLVQTDDTIMWVLAAFRNGEHDSSVLEEILVDADPALIAPRLEEIKKLARIDGVARNRIVERQQFDQLDTAELWCRIEQEGRTLDNKKEIGWHDLNRICDLSEAISRRDDFPSARCLEVLEQTGPSTKGATFWIQLFAIAILGRRREDAAVPYLIPRLDVESDFLSEDALQALTRIATDNVVEALVAAYPSSQYGYRYIAAEILGNIHSDAALSALQRLLETETDQTHRSLLTSSLLQQCCVETIEPARQMVLAEDYDDFLVDLQEDVVLTAIVAEVDFPELDEWKEATAHRDDHSSSRWEPPESVEPPTRDHVESYAPRQLVSTKSVGRNDPCPCGSGKKYKKCCLESS